MAGDDDIVVTIEGDDAPSDGDTTVVVAPEGGTQRTQPDDPMEALKAQLAQKTKEVEQATQRATTAESVAGQAHQRVQIAEREVTQARTEVAQSTKATIDSGLAAAKAEQDAGQEAFEAAFEAGDKKALSGAQLRIARAAADIAMLEQAKAELPSQPVKRAETQQQQPPANQTEAWISGLSGPSQTWVRNHMDFATDARKNAKVVAAHHDAVGEGITPDSKEYFEHLETFLGMKQKPQAQDTKTNGAQPSQRRPSAPVAPVTPTGGGVSGGSNNEVRLTKGEAERATDGSLVWNYPDPTGKNRWQKGDVIGIQEMARRKQALAKEGRYHNGSVDGT